MHSFQKVILDNTYPGLWPQTQKKNPEHYRQTTISQLNSLIYQNGRKLQDFNVVQVTHTCIPSSMTYTCRLHQRNVRGTSLNNSSSLENHLSLLPTKTQSTEQGKQSIDSITFI